MEPVVNITPSCGLKGKLIPKLRSTTEEERDVYAFLGVPYAEPPVGSLRFADPIPASLWSGIRSATEFGGVCPQDLTLLDEYPFPIPRPHSMSEDCLFLNVWTPSLEANARLPVMVWIHGGAFLSGFSDMYDGRALACFHNVVVVTVNYRVGALGFLCVDDKSAMGNYGILDQIEALKWVHHYISHFGGNPDNVTIFGESAGGMSVSLLILSPLAKGLFSRAIAQSGSAFSADIAVSTPEKSFKRLWAFMRKHIAGCPPSTARGPDIVEFLRRQPVEVLTSFKRLQFGPVLDGRVLLARPAELYTRGAFNPCEMIVGCNSDEGQFLFAFLEDTMGLQAGNLTVDLARIIITNFLKSTWTTDNAERAYEAIADYYLQDGGVAYSPQDLHRIIIEFFGDFLFVMPTIMAASYHSRRCRTYVYQFCHRPPYAKYPDWIRADHGSEMFYALRLNGLGKGDDEKLSRLVATYWTNFARTGNPNGDGLEEWAEYNDTTKRHLTIQLPVKAASNLKENRADFWLRKLPAIVAESSSASRL